MANPVKKAKSKVTSTAKGVVKRVKLQIKRTDPFAKLAPIFKQATKELKKRH